MFNAHVQDEAQYERDPLNPNFLKRKPNPIEGKVTLPDNNEVVELDDNVLENAEDLVGDTNESKAQLAWLMENHLETLKETFDVDEVSDLNFKDQEILQRLDALFRQLRSGKHPQKKIKTEPRLVTPLSVQTMTEIVRRQLLDYNHEKLFPGYDELQQAQAAFLYEQTEKKVDKDKVSQTFFNFIKNNQKWANLYNTLYNVVDPEQRLVEQMEAMLDPVLQEAMQPLYNFIGCIDAVERYSAKHYSHFYPMKKGNKSLDEFRRNNRHLGNEVLVAAADYTRRLAGFARPIDRRKLVLIGNNITYPALTVQQKQLFNEELADLTLSGAPHWIYCMIGSATMRFMLSYTTYGAMQMAAQELGFADHLKDLIDSPDVSHKFAEYVAHKFFTAQGGVAQVSSITGGSLQYRISSGFNTTRQANHKWLLGCKLWFKQVYWATVAGREQAIAEAEAKAAAVGDEYDRQDAILGQMLEFPGVLDKYNLSPRDFYELRDLGIPDPNVVIGQSAVVKRLMLEWKEAELARLLTHCHPERVLKYSSAPTRSLGLAGF